MADSFQNAWITFRQELQARTERLQNELSVAWEDVHALLEGLKETSLASEAGAGQLEPGKVASLQTVFEEPARRLLLEPLAAYQKKRPLQRALTVLQDYESGLQDMIRQLPARVNVSGVELANVLRSDAGSGWRLRLLQWRKSPRPVAFRAVVSSHLQRQGARRLPVDGAFQLLLAQACLHLQAPWQAHRRALLTALAGRDVDTAEVANERRWWAETTQSFEGRASRILAAYKDWTGPVARRLADAVLRRSGELTLRERNKILERRQGCFSYWSRQQRSVQSLLDLERQLALLERAAAEVSAGTLQSVEAERRELAEELDSVIGWLEAWQRGGQDVPFPPPKARLLTAEDRISEWTRELARLARARIPVAVEAATPKRDLPGWRSPFRQLEPERVFLRALNDAGKLVAVEGLREVEEAHKATVREIERSREVVKFGFESSEPGRDEGKSLALEAVANALSLLHYQKKTALEERPAAERSITRAQCAAILDTHVALEESRLGAFAYLTRQRGTRRARQLVDLLLEKIRALFRKGALLAREASRYVLMRTGWVAPPTRRLEPVNERAYLGRVLEVTLGPRELPMLYRRLFRLAPVEDPRFLVGRDAEMQGLADALARWEAGRSVSVIVIGARGSGKTSLLNCAVSSLLNSLPVVQGQFCTRAAEPEKIDRFLRGLFQFPDQADLKRSLAEGRRVVVLEELERTFLRKINGFEGLRSFLHLMESTSKATLWILSINETSFRYLDAALSLSRAFSHRINAMAVPPRDITSAIMQRHNLSGLRLQFAPPPEGDPRVSRAKRFFGLEQEPQQLFFEGLYEQSEGIFRSAYELWQDCIERVEAGLVHMRQPLDPNYRPLLSEMKSDDLFTLQAVLQHGGLTDEEMAQVFGVGVAEAQRRLERLLAIEILEPEPACPGFRIRPQAGRFVRDALHRQNLL